MGKNILANPVRNSNGTLNPAGKQRSIISNGVNDKGIALVVALMMLLVLTLIGISAITTTTYEASISGNERVGTDAFYASESGIQVNLNQLPNTNPISRTKVGEDSYYWSGSPQERNLPRAVGFLGLYALPGFDVSWEFKRYQVNATGESFRATREIEVQVAYGPVSAGTQY
jgi:hypothetical protein